MLGIRTDSSTLSHTMWDDDTVLHHISHDEQYDTMKNDVIPYHDADEYTMPHAPRSDSIGRNDIRHIATLISKVLVYDRPSETDLV